MDRQYYAGLDLGLAGEFTSLAVLERTVQASTQSFTGAAWHYAVRLLERFPLGTPHAEALAWLAERTHESPLRDMMLVIDQTSVGRPVVDSFRRTNLPVVLRAVVITAGHERSHQRSSYGVPKRELASVLQLALQERRIKIAEQLPHAQTLFQELLAFRPTMRTASEESVDSWRERAHDDLVFSVALPIWMSERASASLPQPEECSSWMERLTDDIGWERIV